MEQTIRGQFLSLLDKVQSALQENLVSAGKVRQFLTRYFRSSIWVKMNSDIGEIFDSVSVAKLWNFDHYGPLEEVVKQLLPSDSNAKKLVVEYKNQFNAYRTATKITDYIKQSKIEVATLQDPDEPLAVHNLSFMDYRKLKMKLELPVFRKLSAVTLSDVDELWRSLAQDLDLPCLTAVLHSIIIGSIEITWLIMAHVAEEMISIAKALGFRILQYFCQLKNINELIVGDIILYNEEIPSLVSSC